MTAAELRALAMKIAEGKVWGSWDRRLETVLQMVFMPVALGAGLPRNTAHVYAVYGEDHHIPGRAINGQPMFTTCHWITKKDWAKLVPLIEAATAHRKAWTEGSTSG